MQIEKEFNKAENEFRETVGACYVFLKRNTTLSDDEITIQLQNDITNIIEELRNKV